MASLTLVEGPAGGGKSAVVRDMQEAGEVQVAADVTALWAALSGAQRDPETGRYPVRSDDDPALHAARVAQTAVAGFAVREGYDVAVTTSRRGQEARWRGMAEEARVPFRVRTVDPGMENVIARLQIIGEPGVDDTEVLIEDVNGRVRARGKLSGPCRKAANRWYRAVGGFGGGPLRVRPGRSGGRRR